MNEVTLKPLAVEDRLAFRHLPAYARFIRENHLLDYIRFQLKGARELNTPLLKIFGDLPDEQIIEASIPGHTEFLMAAEHNKLGQLLHESIAKWINNQLEVINRDEIEAEDITQVSYLRKTAFMHFLPLYTADMSIALGIAHELDTYQLESDTLTTNTYIDILQDRLSSNTEALKHSEELYRQAQSISRLGNWSWDLTQNKFAWSDELYRIYGLEPGTQISFESLQSYNDPGENDKVNAAVQETLETLKPFEFYYRITAANGERKILHAHGEVLADDGKPFKLIGTLQDVTEQQLAERELRKSREFIQKITNTTPSLIASYNINTGKYTFVNKALKAILGYDSELLLEQGLAFFADIIHPDDMGRITEENNKALEEANNNPPPPGGQEMIVDFKYRLRHKNGEYRWMHTYGTIFDRDRAGKVEHLLNVTVDITDQENAERLIQQKNIELQQSNASLEEYAYVASHDLKEPLRKIATFSDKLLTSQTDRLNEDGKLYLNKIIESSQRMQKMVSDLLSVSVISGNKEFEQYSLQNVLNEVKQTLDYKIEERQAIITSGELPTIKMVPAQMRQLFQNLISNSLKFSRKGIKPEISINCKYLNGSEVTKYNLAPSSRYMRIDVSDNGIGFDIQYVNKIFSIFQRLHGKSEYEGTGIGLAICKKIAENHGGTIIADSTIGFGSTFTIIIPV